jgi:hypothetical protein
MSSATVTVSQSITRNHVAAIVDRDGQRLGHVVARGLKFAAFRKTASTTDLRRMATGFKTIEAAAAFVAA